MSHQGNKDEFLCACLIRNCFLQNPETVIELSRLLPGANPSRLLFFGLGIFSAICSNVSINWDFICIRSSTNPEQLSLNPKSGKKKVVSWQAKSALCINFCDNTIRRGCLSPKYVLQRTFSITMSRSTINTHVL